MLITLSIFDFEPLTHNVLIFNDLILKIAKAYLYNNIDMVLMTFAMMGVLLCLYYLKNTPQIQYDFATPYLNETSLGIHQTVRQFFGIRTNGKQQRQEFPKIVEDDDDTMDPKEKANELFFIMDRYGHILYANQKTLLEFHSNLGDFLGESIFDIYECFGNKDRGWYERIQNGHQANNLVKVDTDGQETLFLINYSSHYDATGEVETIIATCNDVSFLLRADSVRQYYSDKDQLTGLVSQYGMFEQIRHLGNVQTGLSFFIQVQHFSHICNYYGHEVGDKLLSAIAKELQSIFPGDALIVRYTESEFVVLCVNVDLEPEIMDQYVKRLRVFTTSSYEFDDLNLQIDKRVGYAVYPEDTSDIEETVSLANIALKEATSSGSLDIIRFDRKMKEALKQNIELSNKLREALDEEIIEVFFQKAIDCSKQQVFVIEELSRWNDPDLGYVPPNVFFKVAKETNQLHRLDRYMVKKSLLSFAKLRQKDEYKDAKLTINISPTTLLDINFFEYFNQLVEQSGIQAKDIYIEISETTFVNNVDLCVARINQFKQKGYLIALDDFGTEYSSLSILETVDFDIIKIDAHFVQNIDKFSNQEIIKMIRTITAQNAKEIVAEGVETAEQSLALRHLGCEIQQGYYHHRPENLLLY